MSRSTGNSPIKPDIITYSLNGKMAYVPPGDSYESAVQHAKTAFPDDLANVDPRSITLSVTVTVKGKTQSVRITPMVWPAVSSRLARYEIIEVYVRPRVVIDVATDDSPPLYDSKEEKEFLTPRTSSHSPPQSRSPSPSPSNLGSRAVSWLERHLS